MNNPLLVVFSAVVAMVAAPAAGHNQITVTRDGWTVTADTARSVVRISHQKLGANLENGQLNIESEHGLKRLGNWTVEKKGPGALSIRTSEPPSIVVTLVVLISDTGISSRNTAPRAAP